MSEVDAALDGGLLGEESHVKIDFDFGFDDVRVLGFGSVSCDDQRGLIFFEIGVIFVDGLLKSFFGLFYFLFEIYNSFFGLSSVSYDFIKISHEIFVDIEHEFEFPLALDGESHRHEFLFDHFVKFFQPMFVEEVVQMFDFEVFFEEFWPFWVFENSEKFVEWRGLCA